MISVSIAGSGWVGKSMKQLFPEAYVYDEPLGMGNKEEANKSEVMFVCVPTPLKEDGSLDCSIVEEIVSWCTCPLIIIRSTVNPGTSDHLINKYNKAIVFQPEFLGETPAHPMIDPKTRQWLVLGGEPLNVLKAIRLYQTVYNANIDIRQMTLREAEICKLTENRAIAAKVIMCHELFKACEKDGTNYYTIRDAVFGADPRFNLWFTFVYPDKLGFENSKCLKKDVPAWAAWARSVGLKPELTDTLVKMSYEYANNTAK